MDEGSGLVHCVVGTAANVAHVTQVDKLLHGDENVVCADADYTGLEKRTELEGRAVIWQIPARRSTYQKLGKRSVLYKTKRKIEKAKAQIRAQVEHPDDQTSVRLCEDTLPWRGQEHGAAGDAVCAGESMDGRRY